MGVELIITSPYLMVDYEIQLSTPTTANADECVPKCKKMEQQNRKRESTRIGEGRGVGTDLMS
jgi:hypothetical protein